MSPSSTRQEGASQEQKGLTVLLPCLDSPLTALRLGLCPGMSHQQCHAHWVRAQRRAGRTVLGRTHATLS